jgi:hypothetical protein
MPIWFSRFSSMPKHDSQCSPFFLLYHSILSIFSWFGILALIQSLVNQATIGPIVFFVGLMVNQEALDFMPSRHYVAYIIGMFPSIYDWVTNVSDRAPLTDDGTYNTNTPGTAGWVGVLAWKRGALLVSMLWVAILVNVIDRQWKLATIWAVVASLFSLVGIIHMPVAGFDTFGDPVWEQCSLSGDEVNCWDYGVQWMFFVAYMMMGATFLLIGVASKFDETIGPPIDDETRHAFDDWFKDAYTVSSDADDGVDPTKAVHDETRHACDDWFKDAYKVSSDADDGVDPTKAVKEDVKVPHDVDAKREVSDEVDTELPKESETAEA